MNIETTMTTQHRACDGELIEIERAARAGLWDGVRAAVEAFVRDTEAHFRIEEGHLFPALVAAQPMAGAPVGVMCAEHAEMRAIFETLGEAAAANDAAALGDAIDTLFLLMQQHNTKEERILYPLADRVLSGDWLVDQGLLRGAG